MAKGIYFGVADKARKVKKLYFGVGDKARKIKKVYFGVADKARICFSGEVRKYTYFGNMSYASNGVGWNSKYVVMPEISNSSTSVAFDKSLVQITGVTTTDTSHDWSSINQMSGSMSDKAIFMGGRVYDNYYDKYVGNNAIDMYDTSLVKTKKFGGVALYNAKTINFKDKLFAAGGQSVEQGGFSNTLYSFDSSLVVTTSKSLTRSSVTAGAIVGNYAVFTAGWYYSSPYNYGSIYVDAYDPSMVKAPMQYLSTERYYVGDASNSKYAIFAGGRNQSGEYFTLLEAFDSSLVKSVVPSALSVGRSSMTGISTEEYAIIAGGFTIPTTGKRYTTPLVEMFDTSLVRSNPGNLSSDRMNGGYAYLDNYTMVVNGTDNWVDDDGWTHNSMIKMIDVYSI